MKRLHLTIALFAGVTLIAGYGLREQGGSLLSGSSPDASESSEDLASGETLTSIEKLKAARELAWEAAVLVQHPPHAIETWQKAKVKWRQAVHLLEAVPQTDAVAPEAKQRLVTYQRNYAAVSSRLTAEQAASANFEAAQTLAWQAAITVQNPPHSLKVWQRASQKWQDAIALLKPISGTTSVFAQSQEKLETYRRNQSKIEVRIRTETQALLTLKQFEEVGARLSRLPTKALAGLTVEQVGIEYQDYADLVQTLDETLIQFAQEPGANSHPSYPDLVEAINDYKFALSLWQSYLDFKQKTSQLLYDDLFDRLIPVSLADQSALAQKYRIKTYSGGKKISLKFTVWGIWDHATESIRRAQQKVLSLS